MVSISEQKKLEAVATYTDKHISTYFELLQKHRLALIDCSVCIGDLLEQIKKDPFGKSAVKNNQAYEALLYYLDPVNSAAASKGENKFLKRPRVLPDVEAVIIKLSSGRVTLTDAERERLR